MKLKRKFYSKQLPLVIKSTFFYYLLCETQRSVSFTDCPQNVCITKLKRKFYSKQLPLVIKSTFFYYLICETQRSVSFTDCPQNVCITKQKDNFCYSSLKPLSLAERTSCVNRVLLFFATFLKPFART